MIEFYPAAENKSLSEPTLRPLPELHEARGKLLTAFCQNGFAVASFAWGAIALPEELEPKLRELLGREIAMLRLDGRYHIREA